MNDPIHFYHTLSAYIGTHIKGQTQVIRHILAAFISGGHVLLEDLPGTGKTTLAKVMATGVEAEFRRIQFTPDLLPSDIVGVSIFDQREQAFQFHRGPVFSEILLADEINRASPRTQSALLEAMEERQVSVDGVRYPLSDLFFVIATQNPVEFHGTYPLPEAQMDRFALRTQLGYIALEEEISLLGGMTVNERLQDLRACINRADILSLRQAAAQVRISEEVKHYLVSIVRATRTVPGVIMGASPRAAISLLRLVQALALFDGLTYVLPDHIQEIAVPALAHRLKVDAQAHFSGRAASAIITEIVRDMPVPV
jgi:MoxR-like ATPase